MKGTHTLYSHEVWDAKQDHDLGQVKGAWTLAGLDLVGDLGVDSHDDALELLEVPSAVQDCLGHVVEDLELVPTEVIGALSPQILLHEVSDLYHRGEARGKWGVPSSREDLDVLHHGLVGLLEVLVIEGQVSSGLEVSLGQRGKVGVHGRPLDKGNLHVGLDGVDDVLPCECPPVRGHHGDEEDGDRDAEENVLLDEAKHYVNYY